MGEPGCPERNRFRRVSCMESGRHGAKATAPRRLRPACARISTEHSSAASASGPPCERATISLASFALSLRFVASTTTTVALAVASRSSRRAMPLYEGVVAGGADVVLAASPFIQRLSICQCAAGAGLGLTVLVPAGSFTNSVRSGRPHVPVPPLSNSAPVGRPSALPAASLLGYLRAVNPLATGRVSGGRH